MRAFVLLLLLGVATFAEDIRQKVATPTTTLLSETIDPENAIYGIPFGTTEDQFIAQFGSPWVYLRLSATETGMVYGRTHCFLFRNGVMSGLRISHGVVDWKLAKAITAASVFDQVRWRLSNGISKEMSLPEVKQILGDSLRSEHYERSFTTGKRRVEIDFMFQEMEKEETQKVCGLLIVPR